MEGETALARSLAELEASLGHTFVDRQLLVDALTHRSYVHEFAAPGVVSNERLEFLGDAALGIVTSDLLYAAYPEATEGELTTLRAALVRASTLAEFARAITLAPHLRLGRGEDATGGRKRELLLARAFEAIVGAVYVDSGLEAARRSLDPFLRAELRRVTARQTIKDNKSLLQEQSQARLGATPSYRVIEETGPSHDRVFIVEVALGEFVAGRGEGKNKRQAEQQAAASALRDAGWDAHASGSTPTELDIDSGRA
jgi:ribonuclease III